MIRPAALRLAQALPLIPAAGFVISAGLIFALTGCAKKGAAPAGGQDQGRHPPAEQNQETKPTPEGGGGTTVTVLPPKAYSPAPLRCTAPDVQALPQPLSTAKVIDGEAGDWDLTTRLMTDPTGDSHGDGDLLALRAELSVDHLWLLIDLAPSADADQLRLNFGRLQIGPDQILQNESQHTITIEGSAVHHIAADGTATPIAASEVARKGNVVEAKIPIGAIKYTLASAGWWWQVGYFSTDTLTAAGEPLLLDMMARRYFPSVLATNEPTWFFEGCRLAEQSHAPRVWVLRNFADRDGAYLTALKVARHGAAAQRTVATKRLDDLTYILTRGVAGQKHSDAVAMPNHSVIPLMTEPLATAAQQQRQFEAIVATLTDFYLRQSHSQFKDWPLAPFFRQALTTAQQCEVLGISSYLQRFPGVSHQPGVPFQEFAQIFLASFPTDSLYSFVEGLSGTEDLQAVGAAALKARLGATEEAGYLCKKLPRLKQVTMDDIWAGWLEKDQPYPQRFHPQKLLDRDADDLPELWEDHLRLDSQSFDTDRDGFSDITELQLATSPQDDLSYPGQLVIDREFSDWHKLIGSLVTPDRDASTSQCARSLDLLFSGGIYDHPHLHVGFEYSPIGYDFPYYFEVRVQFTATGQQFMAVIRHDKPGFTLKNASTGEVVYTDDFLRACGKRGCELSLPLAAMGVTAPRPSPDQPVTIQLKAYKLSTTPQLCDQTVQFGL